MEPRKEESKKKKFELLPEDFCQLAEVTFLENFTTLLGSHSLKISGRIYPTEILVRLSLQRDKQLRNENINVSMDHEVSKKNAMENIHFAIDVLASSLQEILEENEEEMEKPSQWHAFQVEGKEVFLKFDSLNDELEKKAGELLGEDFDEDQVPEEEIGLEFFNPGTNRDDH